MCKTVNNSVVTSRPCSNRWPWRHVDLTDYTLQIITKRSIFAGEMYFDDMYRMGRRPVIIWSWFDANRSTFDEDIREKRC